MADSPSLTRRTRQAPARSPDSPCRYAAAGPRRLRGPPAHSGRIELRNRYYSPVLSSVRGSFTRGALISMAPAPTSTVLDLAWPFRTSWRGLDRPERAGTAPGGYATPITGSPHPQSSVQTSVSRSGSAIGRTKPESGEPKRPWGQVQQRTLFIIRRKRDRCAEVHELRSGERPRQYSPREKTALTNALRQAGPQPVGKMPS